MFSKKELDEIKNKRIEKENKLKQESDELIEFTDRIIERLCTHLKDFHKTLIEVGLEPKKQAKDEKKRFGKRNVTYFYCWDILHVEDKDGCETTYCLSDDGNFYTRGVFRRNQITVKSMAQAIFSSSLFDSVYALVLKEANYSPEQIADDWCRKWFILDQ